MFDWNSIIITSIAYPAGLAPAWAGTTITAVTIGAFLIRYFTREEERSWPIAPYNLPFVGHAWMFADSDKFQSILESLISKLGNKNGIFEFYLFRQRWIVLCSSESIMKVMKLRPFKVRRAKILNDAVSSIQVNGVFTAEGETWSKQRRNVAPSLNRKHMDEYFPTMKLFAQRLVLKWSNQVEVVASADISSIVLDLVGKLILGVDFDTLNSTVGGSKLEKDIKNLFQVSFMRTLAPFPYWKIPLVGQHLDGGKNCSNRVLHQLRILVQDYRHRKTKNEYMTTQRSGGRHDSFLEKVVDFVDDEKSDFDDDLIVSNLFTLLSAGIDTSTTTILFSLWEIAHDPKLQQELYEEIKAVKLPMNEIALTDIYDKIPRLRSFLFELLRLKGPGPFLFFEPVQPMELEGLVIQPGTILCAMTRSNPQTMPPEVPLGPNGESIEEFCPRRWLESSSFDSNEGTVKLVQPTNKIGGFLVFGHGARTCPGKMLAEAEILTFLAFILYSYEISVKKNHVPVKVVSRFTETFDNEVTLSLQHRSNKDIYKDM